MKTRISEDVKLDVGIQAQSLNGAATGRYYDLAGYGKALAVLTAGAIAATKTAKVELLQAKDAEGTDSKGIPTTAGQLATATITANALVTKATITLATFLAGGTITGPIVSAAVGDDIDLNQVGKIILDDDQDTWIGSNASANRIYFYTAGGSAGFIDTWRWWPALEMIFPDATPVTWGGSGYDVSAQWDTAETTDTFKVGLKTGAFIICPFGDLNSDMYGASPPPFRTQTATRPPRWTFFPAKSSRRGRRTISPTSCAGYPASTWSSSARAT